MSNYKMAHEIRVQKQVNTGESAGYETPVEPSVQGESCQLE